MRLERRNNMANVEYILKLKDQVTATASRIGRSLGRVNTQAVQTANSIDGIGLAAGAAAVGGIFMMGAELEKTTLFFNVLTQSVETGTKLFKELTQFANSTPFSNQAINKNAQVLLAFGQKAEGVTDTLRMLGDVAGGDQDKFRLVTLAFSQIQAAGRLMGQDLLQLINAGFNPLQEISAKTGESMAVLKKKMEAGAISADLVTEAFKSATGPGGRFYQLTIKMSKTMSGLWSTALGKAQFLLSEFGLSMKGIFTPFLKGAIKAVEYLSKMRAVLFPVLKGLIVFIAVLVTLGIALKAWAVIQGVINALMLANPIGLIIIAVAALVAAVVVAYTESEKFREVVARLWNATKALWVVVQKSLTPAMMEFYKVLLNLFRPIGRILMALFNLKEAAGTTGITIRSILVNAFTALFTVTKVITKALGDIIYFFTEILKLSVKLVNFDFSGAFSSLRELGSVINNAIVERFKLVLKSLHHLGKAFAALVEGDFKRAILKAGQGVTAVTAGIFGVDHAQVKREATKAADAAIKGYNQAIKTAKVASVSGGAAGGAGATSPTLGLSSEAKKLQADGIVSGGGIKTFNINIASLTGINTLTTGTIQEGANQVSQAIQEALLRGLADVKIQ